jgi:hypothetical protein
MDQSQIHFEVFVRKHHRSDWVLELATEERGRAVEAAEEFLAERRAIAVKVTKETLGSETREFRSVTILTKGEPDRGPAQRGGGVEVEIAEPDHEPAPPLGLAVVEDDPRRVRLVPGDRLEGGAVEIERMEAVPHRHDGAAAFAQGQGADDVRRPSAARLAADRIVAMRLLADDVDEVERLFHGIPQRPFADDAAGGVDPAHSHGVALRAEDVGGSGVGASRAIGSARGRRL